MVAWDVMGTLFDIAPVEARYGEAAMPRLLHLALSLQAIGRFVPFPQLVETVLGEEALEVFASLDPFDDAEPALRLLADAGIRTLTLTNGSAKNTETLIDRAGFAPYIDEILTVEQVETYKPAPAPYGLVDATSTVFIAVHDWDIAGALNAGLRAIYVDRGGNGWKLPGDRPEVAPDLVAAVERALA